MQMKGVLIGFGLGMVLLSVIVLMAYRADISQIAEYQEEEIIRQAAGLGMVWPTEDVAEIVRRALEMGMVFENDDDMPDVE